MTSSKIEKGEMLNAEGKKEADRLPGREETKGLIIPPLALAVELCALWVWGGGCCTSPLTVITAGQKGGSAVELCTKAFWPLLENLEVCVWGFSLKDNLCTAS